MLSVHYLSDISFNSVKGTNAILWTCLGLSLLVSLTVFVLMFLLRKMNSPPLKDEFKSTGWFDGQSLMSAFSHILPLIITLLNYWVFLGKNPSLPRPPLFLENGERGGGEGERERERERASTLICCSTHWSIHRLTPVCALTGDWTSSLGITGWHS